MDAITQTTSQTSPASQAKAKADAKQSAHDALMGEINDKGGFLGWVKDLQKEKLEELRKKILAGMGLTEADLSKMSAKERAAVEQAVSDAIQRQLESARLVGKQSDQAKGDGAKGGSTSEDGLPIPAFTGSFARFDTSLLQVLQQTQTDSADSADGKNLPSNQAADAAKKTDKDFWS